MTVSPSASVVVSPPTRGWTAIALTLRPGWVGFPAHAGMDPSRTPAAVWYRRFPRPRGDGPVAGAAIRPAAQVSPPTRGWTRQDIGGRRHLRGFPAHAGMDREPEKGTAHVVRFPRPRGDGPQTAKRYDARRAVSPPTRGWLDHLTVSPPTRGWTPESRPAPVNAIGFPAHAGMDRAGATAALRSTRFPRPRGDGPISNEDVNQYGAVSPPTRGWTRRHGKQRSYTDGFPAHAGMDLVWNCTASVLKRFPRPRGDGPLVRLRIFNTDAVSRPRGDGPHERPTPATEVRVPRPRGDGPAEKTSV